MSFVNKTSKIFFEICEAFNPATSYILFGLSCSIKGIFDKGLKFRAMTLPDTFIEQDNPKKMYDVAGLNASQISKKILDVLFTKDSIKVVKN